jgi:dTDP-4-dehydrorhamnose reductase
MKKVLITGGTGMLGASLISHLKRADFQTVVQGYKQQANVNVDMTDKKEAIEVLKDLNPDIIINLICLSDVEENEKKKDLAYSLNVKPVENITHWIQDKKPEVQFIHVSTDHLYDSEGLNTEDNINIRNQYASSKYDSEQIASEVDSLILRTNFFGKSEIKERQSFTDWIDISTKEKRFPINLFEDVYFSPLSLNTLSKMICHILKYDFSGIFNLGSRDGLSKADFAYAYSNFLNENRENTKLISVDDLNFLASRPKGMMMDVSKFESAFNIKLPTLESEIESYKREN